MKVSIKFTSKEIKEMWSNLKTKYFIKDFINNRLEVIIIEKIIEDFIDNHDKDERAGKNV